LRPAAGQRCSVAALHQGLVHPASPLSCAREGLHIDRLWAAKPQPVFSCAFSGNPAGGKVKGLHACARPAPPHPMPVCPISSVPFIRRSSLLLHSLGLTGSLLLSGCALVRPLTDLLPDVSPTPAPAPATVAIAGLPA